MSDRPSLHARIRAALIERFQAYPLDTRLPSDRDLAQEFGVAFLTINRVMNDLAADGYVVRHARQGTFLAAHDRVLAAAPRSVGIDGGDGARGGGEGAGALLFAYPNYFSHAIWRRLRQAEEWTLKAGRRLVECKLSPHAASDRLPRLLDAAPHIEGVLWIPVPGTATPTLVDRIVRRGRRVALLADDMPPRPRDGLFVIDQDWDHFGHAAAKELLDAGHRRIALAFSEPSGRMHEAIAAGARRALREGGVPPLSTAAGREGKAWQDSREVGYRQTLALLSAKAPPTAAVFDSLNGVRGAVRALWERGLRAPEALSMVASGAGDGEDDWFAPPLTTLDADVATEIRLACELATGRRDPGGGRFLVPSRLHRRESVRALRPAVAPSGLLAK